MFFTLNKWELKIVLLRHHCEKGIFIFKSVWNIKNIYNFQITIYAFKRLKLLYWHWWFHKEHLTSMECFHWTKVLNSGKRLFTFLKKFFTHIKIVLSFNLKILWGTKNGCSMASWFYDTLFKVLFVRLKYHEHLINHIQS